MPREPLVNPPKYAVPSPRIRVLPPDLASQIAAGEVVERPASVVKELIENAVDAGATRVDVTIEAGGIGRIEVADDGAGMSEVDAPLSLERHATSKLAQLSDLDRIASYGFRGEALPSIASVARFRLCTRNRESDAATEVRAEAGSPPEVRPAGAPVGTTVEVRDLFFNVPARRKFLRSTGTESGHVSDVVFDAALARPEISFTLVRDGRQVRSWPRTEHRTERVSQLMDGEELFECAGERGPLSVLALLSRPERARQGAAGLKVLVNGRPVRDRAMAATVAHAYGSVLERGRYPRGVVYLELPPELVDVNVHPQKTEVRFADPRAVTDALHSIVARKLEHHLSLAPRTQEPLRKRPEEAFPWSGSSTKRIESTPPTARSAPLTAPRAARSEARPGHESLFVRDVVTPGTASSSEANGDSVRPETATAATQGVVATSWKNLRFLNQVRKTYLVCEGTDGLYVLDQHAAAERVTFSKLRAAYQSREVPSQALLFPLTVDITPRDAELLEQHASQIAAMGLDVRPRTAEAASIHAVPRLLQRASPERLLRDLLSEVTRAGERGFSDAVDKALATMACHAAVRAGDPMTPDEATALLASLDGADFAGYCPHGRPIVSFTSWAELERKVGRR